MAKASSESAFKAILRQPDKPRDGAWCFLVLPKAASEKLPRRGRTTVAGTLNEQPFQATLEPDGQLSHWLKVSAELQSAAGVAAGDTVAVRIAPVDAEPEPTVPKDLQRALSASSEAMAVWNDTTTLARVDWVHWVESAKQAATRKRRVAVACDKLASGERRVCCFDPSGHYDKSLSAPRAVEPRT